jgi:hypothetical protein
VLYCFLISGARWVSEMSQSDMELNGVRQSGIDNPVDRLAAALDRIAWALDRKEAAVVPENCSADADLQVVAANLDALAVRVDTIIASLRGGEE